MEDAAAICGLGRTEEEVIASSCASFKFPLWILELYSTELNNKECLKFRGCTTFLYEQMCGGTNLLIPMCFTLTPAYCDL